MQAKYLLSLLLLLFLAGFLWGCGGNTVEEQPDPQTNYKDENGNYDFGDWAVGLDGPKGVAARYDLSDEELRDLLEEKGYYEPEVTVASVRQDWYNAIVFLAQLSDGELERQYGADDEGVRKFRAYVAEKFSDVSDVVLDENPPNAVEASRALTENKPTEAQ